MRFTVKIDGKEAGVVAAITPPVDVPEFFGTRGNARPGARPRNDQWLSVPLVADANGWVSQDAGEQDSLQGAGVKPGDIVDVIMERDAEARTVEAPPELKKQLAKSKKAQVRWDEMAFTHKKEMASSISGAKQEETKKRRLEKVMQVLKTGAKWTG